MNKKKVITPCVSICRLDKENICIGCGRTKEESQKWKNLKPFIQKKIINKLKKRKEKMGIKQSEKFKT